MLGLPDGVVACLFDLDGVLTRTATVHEAAWKQTFDELLQQQQPPQRPFSDDDYATYVDGKKREDGVRDFLASRGIHLPDGSRDDPPTAQTVFGVGNRKNALLLEKIRTDGVDVYDGSRRYLQACAAAGIRRAVVSSSANTEAVLHVTGLESLVELRVDGVTARERHLNGKPAPDTFLEAARRLELEPAECAVFEDALAGVEAGRAGRFGVVVGVDRVGHGPALREHGADVVVQDLGELL
ncbi:MAG: beta-phosphoglucomutase family hydrolase [Mycobacteriales bacterium]